MNWRAVYFCILALLILGVIGYRFYDYMVIKNFTLEMNTACDPALEACFTLIDPEEDFGFEDGSYKKVDILARNAPVCLEEHTCTDFSCIGIEGCNITYCSDETVTEREQCTSPITE